MSLSSSGQHIGHHRCMRMETAWPGAALHMPVANDLIETPEFNNQWELANSFVHILYCK